jgi:hypothetical protein
VEPALLCDRPSHSSPKSPGDMSGGGPSIGRILETINTRYNQLQSIGLCLVGRLEFWVRYQRSRIGFSRGIAAGFVAACSSARGSQEGDPGGVLMRCQRGGSARCRISHWEPAKCETDALKRIHVGGCSRISRETKTAN